MNIVLRDDEINEKVLIMRILENCVMSPKKQSSQKGHNFTCLISKILLERRYQDFLLSAPHLKSLVSESLEESEWTDVLNEICHEYIIRDVLSILKIPCSPRILNFLEIFQEDEEFGFNFGDCLSRNEIYLPTEYKEFLFKLRQKYNNVHHPNFFNRNKKRRF